MAVVEAARAPPHLPHVHRHLPARGAVDVEAVRGVSFAVEPG